MANDLEWHTEQRRIGDLVEWENNPRRLTKKQAEDLRASLAKFGYVEEIVVNADGKSIIGGHQRRNVLLTTALVNPDTMVDVRIPNRPLTSDEGIECAIRLNKNVGEWNWDILADKFDSDALKEWGFTEFDFDTHMGAITAATVEPPGADAIHGTSSKSVTCPTCGSNFQP